jgi:hypothetical protein
MGVDRELVEHAARHGARRDVSPASENSWSVVTPSLAPHQMPGSAEAMRNESSEA